MSDHTIRVKICGLKNIEDARAVFAAGADEVGFHVQLEGARAPVETDAARKMIAQLPPTASCVVVTSIADATELVELVRATGATTVQIYGAMSPESVREVKHQIPTLKVWKVITADKSATKKAKEFEGIADVIVLDTGKGGTGKTHNWSISKKTVDSVATPVILAGGLNPDNVAEAIEKVKPYGVDVNSGVTNEDGTKNIEKVKAFINAAKK